MDGDIDLEVLHPVPVRWAPRPTSAERLWFHDILTAVTLRGVPRDSFRPTAVSIGQREHTVFAHDGHAWRPFEVLGGDFKPIASASIKTAVSILGGGDTMHSTRSISPFGSPLYPGDGIRQERSTAWRRTAPDRALARVAEDLTDAARSRILTFFADEIRHDGSAVYVRIPPPLPHAFCGEGNPHVDVSMPGHNFGWAGSPGSLAHPAAYLALVEAISGRERATLVREAFGALEPFAEVCEPDVDCDCFLSQTPQYLWKSWESLTANHATDPAGEGARGAGEAALAVLRPLAARASTGLMTPIDHPVAAEAVHDLAVALLALFPSHGLRHRFDEAARFVELVAWPRLATRDPEAGEVDAALAGLAR